MKTSLFAVVCAVLMLLMSNSVLEAQHKTITVLNFDTQGLGMSPQQMGNLARLELDKLDTFQVMDRYDVAYLVQKNSLSIENCYGKIGLVDVGKTLKSDKMLTGTVELYGESIIISMRLIDVNSGVIEKSQIMEFLNLPREMQTMLRITLRTMFGKPNDASLIENLTKQSSLETTVNNPNKTKLNLSGPRMGLTIFTGETSRFLRAKKDVGGFNLNPVMFQFGYQFEIQYLNQGDFQALCEIIPVFTGLDQGTIIPSLTILNGLRSNKNGLEFAFGPIINLMSTAQGYYDENNVWHLAIDNPGTFALSDRIDSRGTRKLSSGFVFAIGKSFRSGKLNIPVNLFVIPHKEGMTFGLSFGYNAKNVMK